MIQSPAHRSGAYFVEVPHIEALIEEVLLPEYLVIDIAASSETQHR
jgi:hypothetical protein